MSSKPTVDIVIPVLNEQAAIPVCIEALFEYLKMETSYDWRIVVVDNGSTDDTFQVTTDISKIN
ncbi:MAG: glycosyltransferase, partial [Dehalococcoidia bacterium]|nr:glycosyltransferase [Dehalococcoidia bacterium]